MIWAIPSVSTWAFLVCYRTPRKKKKVRFLAEMVIGNQRKTPLVIKMSWSNRYLDDFWKKSENGRRHPSFLVDLHRQFQGLPTWFTSGIFTFSNFWTKIRKCQKTYFWAALEASKVASPWEGDASGPILSATAPTATPIVRKTSPNLDFWAKVGLRLRPGSSIFLYFVYCCILCMFFKIFCVRFLH